MIYAAVVVMTVLGCGDQMESCDYIPGPQTAWKTQAACEAAIIDKLQSLQDAPYPLVTAQCDERVEKEVATKKRAATAEDLQASTEIGEGVEAEENVSTENAKPSVAATVYQKTKDGYVFVAKGTGTVFSAIRSGVKFGYTGVRNAVESTVTGTGNVVRRTIGGIKDTVSPPEKSPK